MRPIGCGFASIQGDCPLNSTDLAHKIIDIAEDKQASDIVLLDLRESPAAALADYFVICTVGSSRQGTALLDAVSAEVKKAGVLPFHPVEGDARAGWTLLDYADVVVHVFDAPTRSFYNLEHLWKEARVVLKMQ